MKKAFIFCLIVLVSLSICFSDDEKKKESKNDIQAFFETCRKLYQEGKVEEVVKLLDEGLEKYPDSRLDLIKSKYQILEKMGRYKEALEAAIETDKLDPRKLRSNSLNVASLYVHLNDTDNAFKWLEITVDRGFQYYDTFEKDDTFKPLKGDKRLDSVIKRIKENIGLDKPVKQFNRQALSGSQVSPSKYKGKVVLIDFWATWCSPCVKKIPDLKKYYAEFKDKGFEIIAINLDSDKEKFDAFMKEKKLEWPVVFEGKGWKDETRELFGVNSIPSYWLVDKKGILRHFGLKGEELRNAIAQLINE